MEHAKKEWKISRMKWKTIFHTSIPISFYILCIVFTEKYIPMSGGDILPQEYSTSISTRIICRQIAVLWLFILCKQRTYCIIVSTYIAVCYINVMVYDFDRFNLFFLCFYF